MKIVAIGDVHATSDRPWDQAHRMFYKWFLEDSGLNQPEYVFLQVGDFFDASTMTGALAHDAVEFFQSMQCKTKIVISGNHDYRPRWGYALDVLRRAGVRVVIRPEVVKINDYPMMLLPFLYGGMKETIEQFAYENRCKAQAVFGHFADREMFGTELDISFLEKGLDGCTVDHIMLGHDHSQVGNYIGSVYPTAHSERGRQHRIYVLDTETGEKRSINLPTFLDYVDVNYRDNPTDHRKPYPIVVDVHGAPSVREGYEKFGEFRVREVFTDKVKSDNLATNSFAIVEPKVLVGKYVSGVTRVGVKSKLTDLLQRTGRL